MKKITDLILEMCCYPPPKRETAMPQKIRLKHERSPTCRSDLIDSVTISVLGDGARAVFNLSLNKMDVRTLDEEAILEDNGSITVVQGTTPRTEMVKVTEFIAQLRPDQALNIILTMQMALRRLPKATREQYGIKDELIAEAQSKIS
jgi:hypothetical protein